MEERPWCAAPSLPTGGVELHSPGNMPLRVELLLHSRSQDRVIEKSIRRPLQRTRFGAVSYGLIKTGRDG